MSCQVKNSVMPLTTVVKVACQSGVIMSRGSCAPMDVVGVRIDTVLLILRRGLCENISRGLCSQTCQSLKKSSFETF